MINISLQYHNVADPTELDEAVFFLIGTNESRIASSSLVSIEWHGPFVQSGMFESVVEWMAKVDISSIATKIAAQAITKYLWDLISQGRQKSSTIKQLPSETKELQVLPSDTAQLQNETGFIQVVPFANAMKVNMVITNSTKRIEIDAVEVDQETLLLMVEKILNA